MDTVQQIAGKYIQQSYISAGIDEAAWNPKLGYGPNRAVLDKLYYYYQQLYFKNPKQFLWAGLARLTGGQVLYGMDNLTRIAKDPCVLTQQIMAVAKDIFEKMAWQHELFIADKNMLMQTCRQLDEAHKAVHPYTGCWQLVDTGNAQHIEEGNKMLLRNEQENTIQPHYDIIKKNPYSARYFWFTSFVMRQIHPYHKRFIFSQPFGDVTQIKYRWQWIDGPQGMWHRWCSLPQAERDRLVALDNEAVIHHRWQIAPR
jgi:hypothetical protein